MKIKYKALTNNLYNSIIYYKGENERSEIYFVKSGNLQ